MQFEKYHVHEIRPENIVAIDDETLLSLIAFSPGLKQVCGHRFANWLQEVFAREWERRKSDGAIERCSHVLPELLIPELEKSRSWATIQTYNASSAAPFWDEILYSLEMQVSWYLKKCEQLMEREIANEHQQYQGN
jgi:hypothetical protein